MEQKFARRCADRSRSGGIIKAAGHPATTMMILTNADDFSKVEKTAAGTVTTADLAMKIEK